MRFLPVSRDTIMAECDNLDDTLALFHSMSRAAISGIAEIIPAARTLMIRFKPALLTQNDLIHLVTAQDISQKQVTSGNIIEIPVHYNGEDLDEVASLLGLSVEEIVRRHTGSSYCVAFTGFAPGFAYLSGGDPVFDVPRRKTPRMRIPAGAVGLAGTFSGIYPQASPGGWQIIGVTETAMFDLARHPPALLQPGDQVRFVDIKTGKITMPARAGTEKAAQDKYAEEKDGTPALRAACIGLPVFFQDQGRIGQAGQGVSPSGALDRGSMKMANRLVGNKPDAAVLEITLGGCRFEVLQPTVLALTGADCGITIETKQGNCLKPAHNSPFAAEAGDLVTLGRPNKGMRSYLALRGSFAASKILGSSARDTLANIGPEPVRTGDTLLALPVQSHAPVATDAVPAFAMPACGETITLDITMGPRTDWFTSQAIELFVKQSWKVTPQSNRIGMRLEGTQPLERQNHNELPSEGTVTGAIQIPASGQPVLFLADRPLTGGYPVIATVADHHLDLAGQIPAGSFIRFFAKHPFSDLNPCPVH